MGRLEVLNNVDHHDLRIRLGHGPEWGDGVNLVLVFPTEFEEVQREYPILIRRTDDGWRAFAMLGFEPGENLFLGEDDWQARYVPAARRVAPFKLAFPQSQPGEPPSRDPVVQIDLDHPRARRDEGAPVFLAAGGAAPFLDHMIKILRAVHVGLEIMEPMFAAFERHNLLEPARLDVTLADGARMNVPDVHTISRDGLARLSAEALEELHRAGFLRLAFMVSASLANVTHLIDRKARHGAAAQPRPSAA